MWNDPVGYESYVGRWSRAIAPRFLAWLALPTRRTWLDVACGTGALTSAILSRSDPKNVVGLDGSSAYVATAQASCRDARVQFVVGNATAVPFPSSRFDVAVSGLALNFMPFDRALAEQHRVVCPGGTIGAYVWDYAGEYEFARRFWDAAMRVDARAAAYDPGRKSAICRESKLREALVAAGCTAVETCLLDDWGEFSSPEAYWHAFDGRQGSTFEYLSLLTDEQRSGLKASLLSTMKPDAPVRLKIRAIAVRGTRG